jgi:dTDP-4-dehydrorhamnose 3,5-epimerase
MHIHLATLPPARIIDPVPIHDARGFFARLFDEDLFDQAGLPNRFMQTSLSRNPQRGTLRGLHYQSAPSDEGKLVRCVRGAIYDVIVDLRAGSPTFRQWSATELEPDKACAIYVPPGFAHGFQTLCNDSDVFYQITTPHRPERACGVRWNDPAIGVTWPLPVTLISERDAHYPDISA